MIKIIIGLICVMIANILLGSSIAKLRNDWNFKKFINGFFKNLFKSLNVNFIDASWFISDIVNKIIWDSCNGTIGIIIFIHK